jgi:hypothetical protein
MKNSIHGNKYYFQAYYFGMLDDIFSINYLQILLINYQKLFYIKNTNTMHHFLWEKIFSFTYDPTLFTYPLQNNFKYSTKTIAASRTFASIYAK